MKYLLQIWFFFLLPMQFCFAQWVQTDTSLHRAFCLATRADYLYAGAGYDGHLFISTDNGNNWNSIEPGFISDYIYDITFSGENIIAAGGVPMGRYGHIYLSTDNGTSWSEVENRDIGFYSLISKDNYVFAAGYEVWYSSDSGITWDAANFGSGLWIGDFAVSDSKIYAGSPSDGVFRTTDNGMSWIAVNNGFESLNISALAVLETYVFAVTGEGVFRTSDDGASWLAVNSGIAEDDIGYSNDFAVVGTNIFASIDFNDGNNNHYSRVYLSTNFGEMWSDVSTGLPEEIVIYSLAANVTYLFAGNALYPSPWAGVWRRPLSEIITDVDGNINYFPQDYNLSQNYPNPFNPTTKIKYSIPQTLQVQIKVFDVLGNELETLMNEEKPAGAYEIIWNGKDLPSGVYFYQLRVVDPSTSSRHSFVQTKKMLLIK